MPLLTGVNGRGKGVVKYLARMRLVVMLGFGVIVVLLWCDELFDLPNGVLGAPVSPLNIREAMLESLFVVGVALACWFTLRHIERYVRHLEGFTVICAGCKRVHVGDQWTTIEQWVGERTDVVFSHGLCNECRHRFYPELEVRLPDKP